jgi:alpha-methylacyl-CoA racemase
MKKLSESADVVIEPFRPGVMEGLSLGPKDLMATNEKLIYARMTGYGQSGSLAKRAGHDINYLAIAGILSKLGPKDTPSPPINILGDFAGL